MSLWLHPRRWALGLLSLAVVLAAMALSYSLMERSAVRTLRAASVNRLDLYAASLESELNRYDYLPPVVALNQDVVRLLRDPRSPELRSQVNRYLEVASQHAGASAVYIMDTSGMTLAASNWRQPMSFVGMNFAYRPYFHDAVRGLAGRFYGIGNVSREPGYYFSWGIRDGDELIGVAAVKVSLDKLDQAWSHANEKIIVSDRDGIIFLSSEQGWKFGTLRHVSEESLERLRRTRQYEEAGVLKPIGLQHTRRLADGAQAVSLPQIQQPAGLLQAEYLLQNRQVPGTDWSLIMLSDLRQTATAARTSAIIAAFAAGFLMLLILYLQQRRRSLMERLASREALQRAHDELELKVQQRTEALSDANIMLQSEVAERKRAEQRLQATLEDLVQTGKMAVLGQMSAGITHELNQPLAALRTLAANTIVFLKRGQQADVESNLRTICHVTDHMGKITSQLKKFARKSGSHLNALPIAPVVDDALSLLQQRIQGERVTLECDLQPGICALGDSNRLEQVLLNLLSNALDAVAGTAAPHVLLRAACIGETASIEVHDSGPGIPPDVAPRLFEPFFTTKAQGKGLGLGLAISSGIVRDFGGSIRIDRSHLGGALFTVNLRAAPPVLVDHGLPSYSA